MPRGGFVEIFRNSDIKIGLIFIVAAVISPILGLLSAYKDGILFNTSKMGAFVMLFSFSCIPILIIGLLLVRKGIRSVKK